MQAKRHDELCIVNLVNLTIKIDKGEVIDEISRLKAFLHSKQSEIKDRERQRPIIVESLADWTNNTLRARAWVLKPVIIR